MRRLLSPLHELNRNREEWSSSVLTLVKPDIQDKKATRGQPMDHPTLSLTDVEQRISQLSMECALAHSTAQSSMIAATNAVIDLKTERQASGTRKAGVATQRLLSSIGEFLQGFSDIAEVVKAADQQFGGLAYGTVSVLATVAVRKVEQEDLIEEVLEELTHAFPRMNVLEYIEPRNSLRALIVGAFEMTVLFCRRASEYCTASSLRRVKEASLKKEKMLKTVSRLRVKLSEIHRECEVIMVQDMKAIRKTLDAMTIKLSNAAEEISETKIRLQEVQARSREVHATGEDTNNRVREGQVWMERQERSKAQKVYLAELRKTLDLKDMTKTADAIFRVRILLRRLSENQERDGKCAVQSSPNTLKMNTTFLRWCERSQSSMLVLGGYNFIRETDSEPEDEEEMTWLSCASAWFAEEALRKPSVTLSYFGQLTYTVRRQQRQSFWYVIKTFVYQLAQTLPENSMEEFEKAISEIDSQALDGADNVGAIEHMTGILIAALAVFPGSTTISVVLDRLDQCLWDTFAAKGVDGLGHAVRFLLQLARHPQLSHLSIKILLVMNNRSAVKVARTQKWVDQFESITNWCQEAEE